ncbi:hypothetical protein P152DRAFT_456390 [Eremomyces bilateralis CBS 781.70]|uniref:Vacuolar membrane-associated protein IML1 n=1 Tax=Eremomyces bilateralis CBS 781.70 TaxID=1392243 RepID=A0A6G1G8D4_9PEZI|nr:uncharacterized protein P152DRAFT_456390 [Eremomyces bilateralis CBS 781.70]KAF1814160.1 hypothetical protein P152DRAFT_456390 [Eremomyces bilateralis CBS 781.70]
MATPQTSRIQKICTLWTHQEGFSKEDVVFNADRFQELGLLPESMAQIIPIKQGGAVMGFQNETFGSLKDDAGRTSGQTNNLQKKHDSSESRPITLDENGVQIPGGKAVDAEKAFIFITKDATPDLKTKHPGLHISVAEGVAASFGLKNRMQVVVSAACSEIHAASHVELTFRDQYLSRADMWQMAISELSGHAIYRDQRILFLGAIKATVKNVYIDGQKRKSAYFSPRTKAIFRSESARYILFIQMSREMWDFDSEGSGEIMFNKVINGFLPELFKHWMSMNSHHLVSIILFTRLEYDDGVETTDEQPQRVKDFYRVVVSDMASADWVNILYQLKREFKTFLRDVSITPQDPRGNSPEGQSILADGITAPSYTVAGTPTMAVRGNVLEAINLASSQFSKDYIDRDLIRTGISVVVISAGTGVFEVDYPLLKLTTDTLIGSGIGIDLVCLSPMPLHSVPLFKYRNPRVREDVKRNSQSPFPKPTPPNEPILQGLTPVDKSVLSQSYSSEQQMVNDAAVVRKLQTLNEPVPGEWSYAMPHWVDISFWTRPSDEEALSLGLSDLTSSKSRSRTSKERTFQVRCRMYELQMMGVMENEMSNISIPLLREHPLHPSHRIIDPSKRRHSEHGLVDRTATMAFMDKHDEAVFHPIPLKHRERSPKAQSQKAGSGMPESNSTYGTEDKSDPKNQHAIEPTRAPADYLEWNLKKRPSGATTFPRRKQSATSLFSNADSTSSRPPATRKISFFGPNAEVQKASAVTEVSTPDWEIHKKNAGRGMPSNNTRPSNTMSFTRQILATLTRSNSSLSSQPQPPGGGTPGSHSKSSSGDPSRPSKPIDISSLPIPDQSKGSTPVEDTGSAETIKATQSSIKLGSTPDNSKPQETGAILSVASRNRRFDPRHEGPPGSIVNPIPKVLSPASALSPWLVLVNPCNPKNNDITLAGHFRRWQHVFPKPLPASQIKWKSLCSPAAVPLTNDFFPSAEQLKVEYHESLYRIAPNVDFEPEPGKTRESLVRELIGCRLSHGFQLIIGPAVAEFLGTRERDLVNIFSKEYMSRDGATVFMAVGSAIHQLVCVAGGEVEVRRFNRKPAAEVDGGQKQFIYESYIRTAFAEEYEPRTAIFSHPRAEYNWNYIDSFLAGYHDEFTDVLRFWRARYVLIPVELPKNRLIPELSEEEIRIEGIQKLTRLWEKQRFIPPEERHYQARAKKSYIEANPLQIEYQTRDPSAVVASGLESTILAEGEGAFQTQLFSDDELYSTRNIDIQKLAMDLQGDGGIRMMDRRWHLRLHYNCFIGFDLTTWILHNFSDIKVRQDAENLGNELMDQGLFQHVQRKHRFRDGNFFYQIADKYRLPRDRSWFSSRRAGPSIPSTPMTDTPKPRPQSVDRSRSRTLSNSSSDSGAKTPTKSTRRVKLSKVMRYDVDRHKRSNRPEIINLHYDRLHNPENCYHIRIDWMNVTAKLIDESLHYWATTAERHGLKLVEVPIAEACRLIDVHPFRAPFLIKLAVQPSPSKSKPHQYFDASSFSPLVPTDLFYLHKALLKHFNFVLDMESASSFPPDLRVEFSWGNPDYQYPQYLHRSGVIFAQINDDGEFLLVANRLVHNRGTTTERSKFDKPDPPHSSVPQPRMTSSTGGLRNTSPTASPVVRPASVAEGSITTPSRASIAPFSFVAASPLAPSTNLAYGPARTGTPTAETIARELGTFCADAVALRKFFDEEAARLSESRNLGIGSPRPTPNLGPTGLVPGSTDLNIPTLGLPESITRGGMGTPEPAAGSGRSSRVSGRESAGSG